MRGDFSEFVGRIAGMVAGPVGIAYLAMWALALATMDGGGPLTGDSSCISLHLGPTPMWYCDGGVIDWYAANLANAALLATIWTGVFVLDSTISHGHLGTLAPLMLLHAAGAPCAIHVLSRLAVLASRGRQPVAAAVPGITKESISGNGR